MSRAIRTDQTAASGASVVIRAAWVMRDAWTIINDETQEPVLAMDSAGYPWLLYASRRDAAAGAREHKKLWDIDCHPARLEIAEKGA